MKIQSINFYNVLKSSLLTDNPVRFTGNIFDDFSDAFEFQDDNLDEIIRVRGIIASLKRDFDAYSGYLNDNQKKNKVDIYDTHRKISVCKRLCKNYEQYLKMLIDNPKFAPLFNPEYSKPEKEAVLMENGVYNIQKLAEKLGIEQTAIVTGWYKNGTFDSTFETTDETTGRYIDTTTPETSAFIEDFLKRRKDFVTLSELRYKHNIQDDTTAKYITNGSLRLFGINLKNRRKLPQANIVMVDTNDEVNAKTLKMHNKIHPVRSNYIKSSSVPASYLSKLGFGDIETIRVLIKENKLNGNITKVNTPKGERYKTEVDTISLKNQRVLITLRNKNKNIVELKDLASRLQKTPQDIRKLLLSNKMEIIPEYIFESDYKDIYIDISNPKNAHTIEKLGVSDCMF